jgi:hypothetical protein
MNFAWSDRVRRPDEVLVRPLGRESVLLNLDTESYFGLDEVGTRMLDALTSSAAIEEAFVALLEEFDVAPEKLRADLEAFVVRLEGAGLIQVVDA